MRLLVVSNRLPFGSVRDRTGEPPTDRVFRFSSGSDSMMLSTPVDLREGDGPG
jgi:hypothetical protein